MPGARKSDFGWEIYPEGLGRVLREIQARFPGKPVWITENVVADSRDTMRIDFIRDHLSVLHQAIEGGLNVEGYCHLSLLDNFEWASGFWPRFGLYAVDYKTQARTARESARYYSRVAAENGF